MHKTTLLVLAASLCFASCMRRVSDPSEVIDQSYIHRYGVEVTPDDWSSHGQSGKVVTTLKSGVVVSKNYERGELDGETTYSYPHSDLTEKSENYELGLLKKETLYHRNGTPSQQTLHEPNSTKVVYGWYDNGTPRNTENFQGPLLVKGEYYNLNHEPDSRVENSNGFRTRRDPFGMMLGVDSVASGVVTLSRSYYPNGSVQQEVPYANGQIHGLVKNYLPDGEPSSIETWQNGEKTGATRYFENGELVAEVPYVQGVKEGTEKRYRNGNVLVEEIAWAQDVRHGISTTYIGEVAKSDYYYQGKLVNKATYERMTGTSPAALR